MSLIDDDSQVEATGMVEDSSQGKGGELEEVSFLNQETMDEMQSEIPWWKRLFKSFKMDKNRPPTEDSILPPEGIGAVAHDSPAALLKEIEAREKSSSTPINEMAAIANKSDVTVDQETKPKQEEDKINTAIPMTTEEEKPFVEDEMRLIQADLSRLEQKLSELERRVMAEDSCHEIDDQKQIGSEIEQRIQQMVETQLAKHPRTKSAVVKSWPMLLAFIVVVVISVAGILMPRQTGPGPRFLIEMAILHQALGNNTKVSELLDEAFDVGIGDVEVLSQVGQIYYELGEYRKAVEVLEQAVEKNPQDEEVHLALAQSYGRVEQHQEAIAQYEQLIEINPFNWYYYREMGLLYEALQDYDKAFVQYEKIVEIAPNRIEGYTSLGKLYRILGRYEEAIDQYQQALELDPNVWWIRSALSTSYAALKKWDRAVEQLSAAIELAPDNPSLYLEMGRLYRAQNKYEQALSWYQDALDINSDHVATLVEIGATYQEMEDCEQATLHFLRVLELQPNNKVAQDGLKACQVE